MAKKKKIIWKCNSYGCKKQAFKQAVWGGVGFKYCPKHIINKGGEIIDIKDD